MDDAFKKASDQNIIEQMRRKRAEDEVRGAVERIIDEAAKNGMFDNLPGKGKPLQLGKNRQAGENALAYDLLQNNNYTLPWIAARQEMLDRIEALRAELLWGWERFTRRLDEAVDITERQAARDFWQEERARLGAKMHEINKAITALNLTIPVERLEVMKLQWRNELERAGIEE